MCEVKETPRADLTGSHRRRRGRNRDSGEFLKYSVDDFNAVSRGAHRYDPRRACCAGPSPAGVRGGGRSVSKSRDPPARATRPGSSARSFPPRGRPPSPPGGGPCRRRRTPKPTNAPQVFGRRAPPPGPTQRGSARARNLPLTPPPILPTAWSNAARRHGVRRRARTRGPSDTAPPPAPRLPRVAAPGGALERVLPAGGAKRARHGLEVVAGW